MEYIASHLRRNPEIARQIEEILGLPNDRWDACDVNFGHDDLAQVRITLFLTAEQVVDLARLLAPTETDIDREHGPLPGDET